ncbi:pyridoxal-phosphate-dependent aminotransferase family protein [Gorillibacterium timonense]|uniref:pyridoxal-phosphate-dependent aminotransferase family protein n=1 Tax=Gorillibacterium timonense TaxID=1689269 RepID=UPI00071D3156|nr:aminotransferase class V-fold PLP-dependent enzyme [Gorillibacterium timonense]
MSQYKPLTTQEYDTLHQSLARLLSTRTVPVVIPGEAILGIEAIAAGIAAPGRTILNVVTGPYGTLFGKWLARGGAVVVEVESSFDDVITVEAVAEAIEKVKPSALSFVHAESVTGGTNPARRILELARKSNLITIIDSVSAIGAEPVLMDEWGIDFVTIGAQKGLAGPNGISAVGISDRGWDFLEQNPNAPRNSILSLLDLKSPEEGSNPPRIPANIPALEARALLEALEQIEQEGLPNVNKRHSLASSATIAGLKALGLEPWQSHEASYSPLVTTVRLPEDGRLQVERPIGSVAPGDGAMEGKLLRINHFGANAKRGSVEQAIKTLAELLGQEPAQALAAVGEAWGHDHDH